MTILMICLIRHRQSPQAAIIPLLKNNQIITFVNFWHFFEESKYNPSQDVPIAPPDRKLSDAR